MSKDAFGNAPTGGAGNRSGYWDNDAAGGVGKALEDDGYWQGDLVEIPRSQSKRAEMDEDEARRALKDFDTAETRSQTQQARQDMQAKPGDVAQERINYTTPAGESIEVPVIRAGMPEIFVALQPPNALPYVMAARDAPPQAIVDFFGAHVAQVEELRADMKKRFSKGSYGKCRYQTGDVAYVMGRPFQLRVYPLGERKMKKAARGRATSKFTLNADISLLTLYVVHPKNYDEAKLAFNSYAEGVIMRNAVGMAADFASRLMPGAPVPPVRMRAMRGRWSSDEAGVLWLSTDLVPYPPDCLVYTIWRELEKKMTVPQDLANEMFERVLPGWRVAQQMLADRPEPYCLQ